MKTPKTFVCITNIPTPYRNHFFSSLAIHLSERGIRFKVLFMAESEKDRHWTFKPEDFKYPYQILPGIHPRVKSATLHYNPSILFAVARTKPDWLIMGGSWCDPTIVLQAYLGSLLKNTKKIFWAESNLLSTRYKKGFVRFFRRSVLSRFDAYAVPGEKTKEWLEVCLGPLKEKSLIRLPNVVNERRFIDDVNILRGKRNAIREKYQIHDDEEIILSIIARLENRKGVFNFLKAIQSINYPRSYRILVAGEGSEERQIANWAEKEGFDKVVLLGQKTEDEVLELLAISDLFVLPSLRDPSPLSVIEASFAGLPLMLSCNIGNLSECLVEGENGWSFDPNDEESIRMAMRDLLEASKGKLEKMGEISHKKAKDTFNTKSVVETFIESILKL